MLIRHVSRRLVCSSVFVNPSTTLPSVSRLHTSTACHAKQRYHERVILRRDLPDPEHTNLHAGAIYVESLFDELKMNLNDHTYYHEGDRTIDDMMVRRFVNNVFNNCRSKHIPTKAKYKPVIIKRRLNHMDIYLYFTYFDLINCLPQITFLSSLSERLLSELFGVIVEIHHLPYDGETGLFKGRRRKYELGNEFTPASV